jgi:hypothetical protein
MIHGRIVDVGVVAEVRGDVEGALAANRHGSGRHIEGRLAAVDDRRLRPLEGAAQAPPRTHGEARARPLAAADQRQILQ